MSVLVFPSSIEASVTAAKDLRGQGLRVIGASSLAVDPYAALYDAWARLPLIGDPAFFDTLSALALRHGIDTIHTLHAPIYVFLERHLPERLPQLTLSGASSYHVEMDRLRDLLALSRESLEAVAGYAQVEAPFDPVFLAALLTQAERVFGHCSREKILALCGAAMSAPKGDVVEIGAFLGKSALVLNRLAARFAIGATLAVDPWQAEASVQHGSADYIQDLARSLDWDVVFEGFLINACAGTQPPFNFVRGTSQAAFDLYSEGAPIHSDAFGSISFAGKIAILHIDGNHDAASVRTDFDLWSRHLAPDAWVIFDDYEWPHGDGPRLVADTVAADHRARITRRFVAGGALFLKIAGGAD